jgi:glycine cleavage system H protein
MFASVTAEPTPTFMADDYLAYKRSKFATRLPTDRVFSASHFWMAPEDGGLIRVGFTKFATRMLGEIVEFDFEVKPGDAIELGQAIGWFEGFKAVSDLYSPMGGRFAGANPDLDGDVEAVHKRPYDQGWIYRVEGPPPDDALTAPEYAAFLDETIDRMMGHAP